MEDKKIDKKFYFLSLVNIIPAVILGGGLTMESLVLIGALLVLVINHTVLVSIIRSVTVASSDSRGASGQAARILFLMLLKFSLLFGVVAIIYLFKRALLTKLFMIIFFQLIIQLVSIKNSYQNS